LQKSSIPEFFASCCFTQSHQEITPCPARKL
jgi:hypothetical protein